MKKAKKKVCLIVVTLVIISGAEIYFNYFATSNDPYFDKANKIVKRKKNTEGIYKTKFTCTGYYKINNVGWNSYRNYYRITNHNETKKRIAIIGHSNIEGLRVQFDRTFSAVLEKHLNEKGIQVEVYTFGFAGMHLAQALHISRYVEKTYKPDIYIIGTLLDDFHFESSVKKNFISLDINSKGDVQEILPDKLYQDSGSIFSFLHILKTFKYIDERTGIGYYIKKAMEKKDQIQLYNDSLMNYKHEIEIDYILNEFEKLLTQSNGNTLPIFFLKFPDILPSYNYDFENVNLSVRIHNFKQTPYKIKQHNFKIIDLTDPLYDDYKKNAQYFDFENDYHFNEHAHKVIGIYLSDYFQFYLQH